MFGQQVHLAEGLSLVSFEGFTAVPLYRSCLRALTVLGTKHRHLEVAALQHLRDFLLRPSPILEFFVAAGANLSATPRPLIDLRETCFDNIAKLGNLNISVVGMTGVL